MRKIEEFINNLDVSALDGDQGNLTIDKFNAIRLAIDAEMRKAIDTAANDMKKLDASDVLAKLRENNAMRRMLAQGAIQLPNAIDGVIVGGMTDAQVYEAYVVQMRMKYGNDWVNEALQVARESGYSFADVVKARENMDRFAQSIEALNSSMRDIFAALGNALSNGIRDQLEQAPQPHNRHDRRASKHDKRMKEGDQLWQRRQRRKYRR